MWQNIWFDRILTRQELLMAFGTIFGVKSNEVLFETEANLTSLATEDDRRLWDEKSRGIRILCLSSLWPIKSFPLYLKIILYDETLHPSNDQIIFGTMCELLQCQIVMGDASLSRTSWLLVKSHAQIEQVTIDFDRYENDEIIDYMIE
ncbi:hypothetical protein [Dictyobacter aurantiacus]|uniref:Uncharacterized protein n=1 Tax=Dictyobacter aurantiacus TaxID=1936993 RepID=A0A401ZCV0_9CHLR|nr:hypothetical protein [Dictyobacter aurantiacus]GCE04704.1 hypothetical protein KDAU_20330 [Dictyobacter aurantiacus]